MDNDIEEMFRFKKNKEKIKLDNNIFCNCDDSPFTNSTSQSNFMTTKGRLNKRMQNNNQKEIKANNGIKRIIKSEKNSSRLNAMKKCFDIVKNRNELNKILMNGCKKVLNDNKSENQALFESIGSNEKDIFYNTYNSFFKKNVDSFINNYLKNNFYVNENVNTLNNLDKYDDLKTKNITVNKNFSLCNLTKNKSKKNKISIKEHKITVDKKKNFTIIKNKSNNKKNTKKISSKKYINVNRMEQFKVKSNNYFSKIKNMFNNKKEKLSKNNSFHERQKQNKSLINIKRKLSSSNKNSLTINFNDSDYKFNDSCTNHNSFSKNINFIKKNNQINNQSLVLKNISIRNSINSNNINGQKLNFRYSNQNKINDNININEQKRIKSEKNKKFDDKKNSNYISTSPTLYNTQNLFYFNSPNFAPLKKIYTNNPYNNNLSFCCKSIKEKNNNVDKKYNKFKTLNIDKNNNEEISKINQIYTNINSSINIITKKNKINNVKKNNSKERKMNFQICINEDKYNTININKNQLINNSFNYISQISNRDDTIPYLINNIETIGNNIVSDERKEDEKNFKDEHFQENSEFNSCDEKYLNTSNNNKNKSEFENKSNNNGVFSEDKNRSKIFENKNSIKDILNNKRQKTKNILNKKIDILKNSKTKKLIIHQKQTNQDLIKNINDFKNKTSNYFFNNSYANKNYGTLKKVPKLLRQKHFSDFNNSFFDKTQRITKKINSNKHLANKLNDKSKTKKENEIKLTTGISNYKYNSNIAKNNNIYKKPFSLISARENNLDAYSNRINNKSFVSDIEKKNKFYGKKKNIIINNKEKNLMKIKNLENYNIFLNNHKKKNTKKSEKQKVRKNGIKDHGISSGGNILKIKSKPNIDNCFFKKYYHFAKKKNIINNCFIIKEIKLSENNNYIYKRQLSLSNKRNNKNIINNIYDIENINGGICPSMINFIYNNAENYRNLSQDEQTIRFNTLNLEHNKNQIWNLKGNSHLKINKINIQKQLDKKSTSIIKYKDFNKKFKLNEINSDNNSFLNYEEESEVTFGRKDQIYINKFNSNKKKISMNDFELNIDEKLNNMNNNTFYYNNENENDKILDDECINGEANYFNNSFSHSNQKFRSNKKIVYDFEINSITNNYYNNNNIILFSPQQKKLYFKYIEKGMMIISNIILKHRTNIYKNLKNFNKIQKNKNKSESVIYMKKKLKDNGAKKIEASQTPIQKKNLICSEEYYANDDILLNSLNKERNLFENKKNNIMKKMKKIRTKSSDYIILEKKDKSLIKKIDVEPIESIDIKNNKKDKNEHLFNPSYNTPRGFIVDERNIVSPHFINNNDNFSKKIENIKNNNNINELMLEKSNIKIYHCTPKFCQIKPKYVEDIKLKENFKDNKNRKIFTMEEIFYVGSSNSLCFRENYLTNEFLIHCDEMLKNIEILDINSDNGYKINNDKQIYNKNEILSLLNKITELNFDDIFHKLNYLMINDNNNQYFFIKIIINKAMNEKKYIKLYANLCCRLYNDILKRINNSSYNDIDFTNCNLNLGFDNDLKNILINESKLKFNSFINDLNKNIIQENINDIKNHLFNFSDFIIELICSKIILFDNIIYYLDKLYKEYINNNNGNNISILYLEDILYILEILFRKIKYIENKTYERFKTFIEEKIIPIIRKSEFSQNYLKFKIINIKDKMKIFFELNNDNNINNSNISFNEKKCIDIDLDENKEGINNRDINNIINNILINNKKIQNIKLLLLNDLQNFLKMKNNQIDNNINKTSYDWFIIDELLFEIHIDLADFILFYIEISKELKINNKNYQYEYFKNVLNYFIQYSLDDINNNEKTNKKILELLLNICWENWDKEEYTKDLYFENLGYVLFLLLDKNIILINDINYFINESISIKKNISNIIKYTILFDKGKYGEYFEQFQQTNFFINNKELFYNIINYLNFAEELY